MPYVAARGNGTGNGRHTILCPDCGQRFEPHRYQKIPLCPYHRRLYDAARERTKKAAWRERRRTISRAYNAVTGWWRSR